VQDTPEFEPAMRELKEAIREHFSHQRGESDSAHDHF